VGMPITWPTALPEGSLLAFDPPKGMVNITRKDRIIWTPAKTLNLLAAFSDSR
jgi:hypothetical protein